jgi:hypothetical protein
MLDEFCTKKCDKYKIMSKIVETEAAGLLRISSIMTEDDMLNAHFSFISHYNKIVGEENMIAVLLILN